MIVYIPTPITSAEQAESLPVGTVATTADVYQVSRKIEDDGAWQRSDLMDDLGWDEDMVGWTALVPVEAHTQDNAPTPGWGERERRHRHVTRWITGPSPDRRGDCA